MVATSVPSSKYRPLVGRSRQPMMFIRVDLPEPDWPIMAQYSPGRMVRLMRSQARTTASPLP